MAENTICPLHKAQDIFRDSADVAWPRGSAALPISPLPNQSRATAAELEGCGY
jgi:hypothetical protein